MAIERTLISSQSVKDNTDVVIEMLSARPIPGDIFSPSRPAGKLCGYMDPGAGRVELYIVLPSGNKFARIT